MYVADGDLGFGGNHYCTVKYNKMDQNQKNIFYSSMLVPLILLLERIQHLTPPRGPKLYFYF